MTFFGFRIGIKYQGNMPSAIPTSSNLRSNVLEVGDPSTNQLNLNVKAPQVTEYAIKEGLVGISLDEHCPRTLSHLISIPLLKQWSKSG